MQRPPFRIELSVDPDQAKVLVRALDLFDRISLGQHRPAAEEIIKILSESSETDDGFDARVELDVLLLSHKIVRIILCPHLPPDPGRRRGDAARSAYDMLAILQRALAKEERDHKMSVWHSSRKNIGPGPAPQSRIVGRDPAESERAGAAEAVAMMAEYAGTEELKKQLWVAERLIREGVSRAPVEVETIDDSPGAETPERAHPPQPGG